MSKTANTRKRGQPMKDETNKFSMGDYCGFSIYTDYVFGEPGFVVISTGSKHAVGYARDLYDAINLRNRIAREQ